MILSRKYTLLIALAAASASGQEVKSVTVNTNVVRSIFLQPASPREGRDPFYPESLRPYAVVVVPQVVPRITSLKIRGFSGTPENRMVIINNHSFGVGDEGDVLTPGGRLHVHCLEINGDTVVIEADNQRRELRFSDQ